MSDAAKFFADLADEQRNAGYWRIATRMLDLAKKEPAYMKAATISLQTALVLDGLAESSARPWE